MTRFVIATLALSSTAVIVACCGGAGTAGRQQPQIRNERRQQAHRPQPAVRPANVAADVQRPAAAEVAEADPPAVHVPQSDLILEDWRFTRDGVGFMRVSGEVTNNTGASIKNVEAVATFYTSDGSFVKTSSALIEYNPILPGQTSPFTVIDTNNPQIASARIAFKEFFGGTISTTEREDREAADAAVQRERDAAIRNERKRREAEREAELLADRKQRAPAAWEALSQRIEAAGEITDDLRLELKAFRDDYEGTDEAALADNELLAAAKLGLAENYLRNDRASSAKRTLGELIEQYPDTVSAKFAAVRLEEI